MREVAVERAAVLVAQRPDAAGKRNAGEIAADAREIRMRQHIAPDHDVVALLGGARVGLDAGDAMADVGGVGRLAHLAVADDVDAGRDLLRDDIVDGLCGLGLEHRGVDTLALLLGDDEIDQRLRPRQAAGVRGENAIGAGFHFFPRVRRERPL